MNETPARSAILHPLRAVPFNDPAVSIETAGSLNGTARKG